MMNSSPISESSIGKRRRIWLWLGKTAGALLLLTVVATLLWFHRALYHRWVRFPNEAAAWQALRLQRQPVLGDSGWKEYRGVLHSHSELSHDSEVPLDEILRVLKNTGIDFICLSDHCIEGRADFSRQWRGLREGKLFVPGFEMKEGLMPFGVASGVVLSNRTDSSTLARQVVGQGGVLFFAHPEEPRRWDQPELTGMEIYNLHTDFKQRRNELWLMAPDLLLNLRRYPDHVYRLVFSRPVDFLKRWDELNRTRKLTGIAANDCHQNVGFRLICSSNGVIRLEDTSPKTIREFKLNWATRLLVRLVFGALEPNRRLWHVQLDPYERSARFVNTHVLARGLSEPEILEALRAGRVFVGFDMVADSSGFNCWVTDSTGRSVMGESRALLRDSQLHARSPLPCRFTVVKDGSKVHQSEGRSLDWTPLGPGKYRVEAELRVLDEWVPWVYANPIELR
jgi:hypothetical protein